MTEYNRGRISERKVLNADSLLILVVSKCVNHFSTCYLLYNIDMF